MKKIIILFATVLFSAGISAQENKTDVQARITLRDGSIYNGSINIKNVDLQFIKRR